MSRRRSVGRAGGVRCWQTGIIEKVRLRLLSRVIDRSGGGVVRSLGRTAAPLLHRKKDAARRPEIRTRAHVQNTNFVYTTHNSKNPQSGLRNLVGLFSGHVEID